MSYARSHGAMQALGARCDICPLRDGHPVPIEKHAGSTVLLVGQAPTATDVEEGRPFTDIDGQELGKALKHCGRWRSGVSLTNAVACRFPNDDVGGFLARISKENKKNKKRPGDEGFIPSPFECCKPRLNREVAAYENRIALGGYAAQALIPGKEDAKILSIRGHQVPLPEGGKVYPTMHPSFPRHQRRWTHVFYKDIRAAFDWFDGKESWIPPKFVNAHYGEDGEPLRDSRGHMSFWAPSVREVRDYLRGQGPWWGKKPKWMVYDLETDGIRPDKLNIRCIGIGCGDHVMIIPFLSVNGIDRFYSPEDEEEIILELRRFAEDETILKVGHNAGSFDRMCFENVWGATPTPLMDTVLVHKGVDAELPHTLNFVGSFYTTVHAWKDDKEGSWDTKYDAALWEYCGLDVCVNARSVVPLVRDARERAQLTGPIPPVAQLSQAVSRDPVARDHAMQSMGVGLHRVGEPVRQQQRAKLEVECVAAVSEWRNRSRSLLSACGIPETFLADAGLDEPAGEGEDAEEEAEEFESFNDAANRAGVDVGEFNPGSHVQVRKLIEDIWELPEPIGLGKRDMRTGVMGDGDFRTGKAVLQAYMVDKRLSKQQRALFHAIFMYRRWAKRFGSEIRPARFAPGETKPKCFIWEDGRIHSQWNAHGTLVGRYATSRPNAQNRSPWFKPCIGFDYPEAEAARKAAKAAGAADKGIGAALDALDDDDMVLVGADIEGIHLRIIAVLWDIPSLRESFELGHDAHSVFAEICMGDVYRNAEGYPGYGKKSAKGTLAAKFRDMAKTLRYAGAYGAEPPTIYRVMRSLTDDQGRIQMPKLELDQVRMMHDNWMTREPEWKRAWDRNIATWKRQGFVKTPMLGRRRYFLDANENDVRNFEILATEGDIMGEVTQEFVDAVPFEYAGPGTGLINQCHDALYAQVRKRDAARVQGIMRDLMDKQRGPIKMRSGSVDVGLHMGEVAV